MGTPLTVQCPEAIDVGLHAIHAKSSEYAGAAVWQCGGGSNFNLIPVLLLVCYSSLLATRVCSLKAILSPGHHLSSVIISL